MSRDEYSWVYILTNRSRTLYIGITTNLKRRVWEHKCGRGGSAFCKKYKIDRLVYFEQWWSPGDAIEREKQLKGWTRLKKIALIVSKNPEWKDLSEGWFDAVPKCIDPSPLARNARGSG